MNLQRPVLSVSPSLRVPWSWAPTTTSADPWGLCDQGPVTVLLWAWSPLETGAAAPPCPSGYMKVITVASMPPEFASMPPGFRLELPVPPGSSKNLDWASQLGTALDLRAPQGPPRGLLCIHLPGP